ncbi:MAG: DUF4118 domain-containing protein [Lachnospiraceae bacterium]|nr:DUF4118 domain-containing protein [Lachnospiraceae bacterium]
MKYKDMHSGKEQTPCVMVCLSPSPSNRRVIRAAAKLAALTPAVKGSAPAHGGLQLQEAAQSPASAQGQDHSVSGQQDAALPACSARPVTAIAIYVGRTGREADEDSRLRDNIRFAREKGFEVHTMQGDDLPLAISEYARREGVTDLFIGHTPPPFFFQTKKAVHETLQSCLPDVDIHIIPDQASSSFPAALHSLKTDGGGISWNLQDLLRVLAVMTVATLLAAWFYQSRYSNANIITVYILAVLIASVMTSSRIYGLFAAVLYVLLFNFLFIDPRYTLLVYDSTYMMTYLVTLVAALITGTVTVRMKNIARISAENAYQAKVLLDTSDQLEMADGGEEIVRTTCMQLVHLLNRAVLFVPADGFFRILPGVGKPTDPAQSLVGVSASSGFGAVVFPAGEKTIPASVLDQLRDSGRGTPAPADTQARGSRRIIPQDRAHAEYAASGQTGSSTGTQSPAGGVESRALRWTAENRRHTGAYTSRFPACRCQYLHIFSGDHSFGTIGIDMDGRPFTEFENTILLSILHECTMALENARMEQEQKKAEIQAENERLRAGLLRSISHDLRTPLTSIYGNASNLLTYEKDLQKEEREKIYGDIMEDASWLNTQFENILAMTKLESASTDGASPLRTTIENMEDVIDESLLHIAAHPACTIRFERNDQLLFVRADPRLLVQVMTNLLNNAVKYTPPGSTVQVSAQKTGDPQEWIVVEVSDNGPGIPDADKPHVFEPFYTGRNTLKDSYRSLGLGLNLCAQIIHIHGGEIEVLDNRPRGTIFRFRLPAAKIPLPSA